MHDFNTHIQNDRHTKTVGTQTLITYAENGAFGQSKPIDTKGCSKVFKKIHFKSFSKKRLTKDFYDLLKLALKGEPEYTVEKNKATPDGGIANLMLSKGGKPRAIIEFHPQQSEDEEKLSNSCIASLSKAKSILRDDPALGSITLIITDGFEFFPIILKLVSSNLRPKIVVSHSCIWFNLYSVNKKDIIFRDDYLRLFFNAITLPTRKLDTIEFKVEGSMDENDTYVVQGIAGAGSQGTVFRCKHQYDQDKFFAIKIGDDEVISEEYRLVSMLAKYKVAPECTQAHFSVDDGHGNPIIVSGLVYPLCNPVSGGNWTPPSLVKQMSTAHCYQLFIKLRMMNELGILHRNIKPKNVVIQGDDAFFIDYGCSIEESSDESFHGCKYLASQRILEMLSNGNQNYFNYSYNNFGSMGEYSHSVCYRKVYQYQKHDDMEGLYKLFLDFFGFNSYRKCTGSSDLKRTWDQVIGVNKIASLSEYEEICQFVHEMMFRYRGPYESIESIKTYLGPVEDLSDSTTASR